jgi:hypothetical protein
VREKIEIIIQYMPLSNIRRITFMKTALQLLLLCFVTVASVPREIAYQGILTDQSKNPLSDGLYPIFFSFYEDSITGSAPVFVDTQNVTVKSGIFSAMIKTAKASGTALPFDKQYWIGVTYNNKEIPPRVKLSSSAYAVRAAVADSVVKVGSTVVTDSIFVNGIKTKGLTLLGAYNSNSQDGSNPIIFSTDASHPYGFGSLILASRPDLARPILFTVNNSIAAQIDTNKSFMIDNGLTIKREGLILNRNSGTGYIAFRDGQNNNRWTLQRDSDGALELHSNGLTGDSSIFRIQSNWNSNSNPALLVNTITGSTVTENLTSSNLNVSNDLSIGSSIIGKDSLRLVLKMNTLDGNDYKFIDVCGGGESLLYRGAVIRANGNENNSAPGAVELYAGYGSTNKPGFIRFMTSNISGPSQERMRIDSSGNIGIGNISPSNKVDIIKSNGNCVLSLNTGSTANVSSIFLGNGGIRKWILSSRGSYDAPNDRFAIQNADGDDKLTITQGGKVGIGTTTPSGLLSIQGGTNTTPTLAVENTLTPSSFQWAADENEGISIFSGRSVSQGSYATILLSNQTADVTSTTLGNLVWAQPLSGKSNTVNPGIKAYINVTTTGTGGNIGGYGADMIFYTRADNDANISERMRICSNGDIKTNGACVATTNCSSSDRRFKTSITPISSALAKIESLSGVYYNWNREAFPDRNFSDSKQIGLIAQDVEKIIPEVVHTDSDGYKSLSYDKLTAVLIEAVKEQQEIIKKQQEQNSKQNELIENLLQRVNALENR